MSGRPGHRLQILGDLPSGYRERIQRAWPEVDLVGAAGAASAGHAGHADAVLAWDYAPGELVALVSADRPPQWIHTRAVGLDPAVVSAAGGAGAVLTNGAGAHGPAVAEHVVAVVLAALRRLPELVHAQQAHRWDDLPVRELGGRLAGVLGTGDLGRCTARLLRAFGVRVRGLRRVPAPVPEMDAVYGPEQLAEFLTGLDLLVIAVPLTPLTRHMVGSAELARLASGSVVVNVGRGPVLDTEALVTALGTGRVAAASLDVFAEEPLPPHSPLWSVPNLFITPHCADLTPQTDERALAGYLDLVRRYRDGADLSGVDLRLGY